MDESVNDTLLNCAELDVISIHAYGTGDYSTSAIQPYVTRAVNKGKKLLFQEWGACYYNTENNRCNPGKFVPYHLNLKAFFPRFTGLGRSTFSLIDPFVCGYFHTLVILELGGPIVSFGQITRLPHLNLVSIGTLCELTLNLDTLPHHHILGSALSSSTRNSNISKWASQISAAGCVSDYLLNFLVCSTCTSFPFTLYQRIFLGLTSFPKS
jgi:hypothetical protein